MDIGLSCVRGVQTAAPSWLDVTTNMFTPHNKLTERKRMSHVQVSTRAAASTDNSGWCNPPAAMDLPHEGKFSIRVGF